MTKREETLPADKTADLKSLMQAVDIHSFRALAARAQVSRWQISQLRAGKAMQMRVSVLAQVAAVLEQSLAELLEALGERSNVVGDDTAHSATHSDIAPRDNSAEHAQIASLQAEYQRLQAQVDQQAEEARSHIKADALQTLESWLTQWPTIAKRAKDRGDELAAVKVLPFVKPLEKLMEEWGVEAIAPVDSQVPFDPQWHQLIGSSVNPGAAVQVTHSGWRYQGNLLHRAKVKPI